MKLLVPLFLMVLAPRIVRADDNTLDARITDFQGSVKVITPDEPDGVAPSQDLPLEAGDRIVTGANGRVEIGVEGESVVELGPNTDFTADSLDRKTPVFGLGLGTLIGKIKAGLFGDGGELQVRTADAVAAVRGTEFGVENEGTGGSHVGVFDEGHVAVRGAVGGEVQLAPNQETSVFHGQRPQEVRALRRFLAHRQRMIAMRRRIVFLHRRWARLPPGKRRAMRQKMIQRRRVLRRRKTLREIMEEKRRRNQR